MALDNLYHSGSPGGSCNDWPVLQIGYLICRKDSRGSCHVWLLCLAYRAKATDLCKASHHRSRFVILAQSDQCSYFRRRSISYTIPGSPGGPCNDWPVLQIGHLICRKDSRGSCHVWPLCLAYRAKATDLCKASHHRSRFVILAQSDQCSYFRRRLTSYTISGSSGPHCRAI